MRGQTDETKIAQLMESLGRAAQGPGTIFFTGGTTAVLMGWRSMTIDVDMKLDPEPAGVFDVISKLKDELDLNLELAAPDDFIPALPGWRERSRFIKRCGEVEFYHYDFYGQALSKIERNHAQDKIDVMQMLTSGLVDKDQLLQLFATIEPMLSRYPAIDPAEFRKRVEAL